MKTTMPLIGIKSFFTDLMQKFVEICYYCGDTDVNNSQEILHIWEQYSSVRPLYSSCTRSGP